MLTYLYPTRCETLAACGDTITFGASGMITLGSTLPSVSTTLTINGTGLSVTLSGNNSVGIMEVDSGGNLSVNALTLSRGLGDAISNAGTLNVANSTFSGNSAPSGGGAIYNSGTTTLNNSILTNGTSGDCSGSFTSANDLSDGSCGLAADAVTNISSTLADNGGTTQTFAMLGGSNAIDAVPNGSCVYVSSGTNPLFSNGAAITTDQRGVARPQGLLCDIGAYEFVPPAATSTPTSTSTSTPTATPTATNTATATATPTNTPSNTPTSTPTNTSTPVLGRIDSIGVFRSRTFYLRLHNSTGFADITVAFGPGTKP